MKPQIIPLQDFVAWGALAGIILILLSWFWRALQRRKEMRRLAKRRRSCAQCGLLDSVEEKASKYGTCQFCGGVTSRGRSRKLG